MNRTWRFLFGAIFVLGCSCQSDSSGSADAAAPPAVEARILSTVAPIEVLVSAIGGQCVQSDCLIAGELDPHSYQLVKGDQEKFRRADLIFSAGLGLEHGPSLAATLNASQKAIALGDLLLQQSSERILMSGSLPDPHLWLDIELWSQCLAIISERLGRLLPDRAAEFAERADRLHLEFAAAHRQARAIAMTIPDRVRYLVTTHDAFRYFARAYLAADGEVLEEQWGERVMAPEGLAPESQTSLQQMQSALQYLERHRVPVVFAESNVNHHSLLKILQAARSRGLKVALSPDRLYGDAMPSHSIGEEGYRVYLEMILGNIKVIAKNLRVQEEHGLST